MRRPFAWKSSPTRRLHDNPPGRGGAIALHARLGKMALHPQYNITPRLAGFVCALFALLLAGCFVADDDDRNPIIPDASMAYPLQTGMMYECDKLGLQCRKVDITRQPWGYQMRG